MSADSIIDMAKTALSDEALSSAIYRRLARIYGDESVRSKIAEIAEMEGRHAEFWMNFLRKRNSESSTKAGRLNVALHLTTMRLLGLSLTLILLEKGERSAVELYSKILESPELADFERSELKKILEDELIHEQEFAEEESKFEGVLTYIRDAILGMNDGLVEILSVTTGLSGVYGSPFYVALGGLIVAIAGATSMGVGVYASVRAQRQVHESILQRISNASRYVAHLFRERLISYMVRKGYSKETSTAMAEESSKDHRMLSRVIAEEEYGLREEALVSPRKAGLYSGLSNAFGAIVPLIPYFLGLSISIALILSLLLAGVALAVAAFIIAVSANLPVKRKVSEMMIVGLGSAGVTFIIGRAVSTLFGINV